MSVAHLKAQQPDIEVVQLTQELAEHWLSLNINNRNKKPGKITLYARDMENGNWRFTGEPIKFNKRGDLVDGQNRCYAVIESGATITVLVVRNLEDDAQEVMDSGVARTAADALHMNGFEKSKDLAAAVAVHSVWASGGYKHCMMKTAGYRRPTNAECVKYATANPELLDAIRVSVKLKRELSMPIGAIITAYVETAKIDPDDCAEFFARIDGLQTYGKGDPVNTLLKRVREMRERRESLLPSTCLYLLFRAWNAFRSGQSLNKFQLGSEGRWATIPDPR